MPGAAQRKQATALAGSFSFDGGSAPAGIEAAADGIVCAWDGRLDGGGAPGQSGAAAAIAAYRTAETEGFRGLIGDWSLVLWDAANRRVVLASDYAGIRPLYYHEDGGRLRWSSSLADLVRRTGIRPLDEHFAAEFLAHGAARHTPYPGIRAVAPGCAVSVSAAGTRIQRFWDLTALPEVRLKDERDYERHLLELFREAVAVRIRPHERVAAELSGGLDSSSVVSMATDLGYRITTFSYTHRNGTDERYFRAVERHCEVDGIHLGLDDYPFVAPDQTGGAAPAWWEPRFRGLAGYLDAIGAGALLTGQLGDFTMGNVLDDSDQAAGWLRRGRFGHAVREAYAWSQALRIPIYPILWRACRVAFSSWAPAGSSDFSPVRLRRKPQDDSYTPRFRRRTRDAAETAEPYDCNWRAAAPDRRRRIRGLAALLRYRRLQTPEPLLDFSYTHPFAHRPLLEFLWQIPRAVVCRPGEPRRLMRRSFRGLLPPQVLARKSKADYTAAYANALRPLATEILRQPQTICLAELGYVDAKSLLRRLERYTQGLACAETQLRQIILLECWLRSRSA